VVIPIFVKASALLGPTDFKNCTGWLSILSFPAFIAIKINQAFGINNFLLISHSWRSEDKKYLSLQEWNIKQPCTGNRQLVPEYTCL